MDWDRGRLLIEDLVENPPPELLKRLRQTAFALVAVGLLAFLIVGASRPANPYLLPANGQVKEASLRSFGATLLTVKAGPRLVAPATPQCALLATTDAQRHKGLMAQRSLHGFAGMVFRYAKPSTERVYMKDTVIPLSVAWFGSHGVFIAARNMAPCPATARACPTYGPGRPFLLALEVPEGRLHSLGIGPGSVLQLAGPCSG